MTYIDVHGVAVPALGFGTWSLRGEDGLHAIATALDVGYRHLDTAQSYGNEREVARALRDSGLPREDVFLTTKVALGNLRYRDVLRTTDESLERLRTDYVDLLLVHWPDASVEMEETLDAFQEVRARGKTRLIGVSNFTPSLLERALELVPDLACNQVEYHPFLGQDTLLELVRKHGMVLTAYSPVARGRVANEWTIQEVAAVHGRSAAQVALRWLIQQDRVAAIPRSANPEHIRDNFEVFDFALAEEEMEAISDLARGERLVDPDFAPWA
ncbi:MAG TPA: aldo/keto reductase [Rubricoccaceae bacterium]|nr:aldo/keto reductase [Rubricoccaceae bacterium]